MDIIQFRRSLDMNQREFASFVGVRVATVSEWESGTKEPSPMARKLLTLLREKHQGERGASVNEPTKQ